MFHSKITEEFLKSAAQLGIRGPVLRQLGELLSKLASAKTEVPAGDKEAYSIEAFCLLHSISRSAFYNLMASGDAPDVFHVGSRVLISREAAARWRQHRTEIARHLNARSASGEAPTAG